MKVQSSGLSASDRAWWIRPDDARDEEDPAAYAKLHNALTDIQRNQAYRKREALFNYAMYAGAMPHGFTDTRTAPGRSDSQLSLNVSRSVVDSVTARVFSKSKPHLSYVTEGGDYEKQHNAEQLERGVAGVFYKTSFYGHAVEAGRLGTVGGTGILRIDADHDAKDVRIRRYHEWEVIADDSETMYDGLEPPCLYAVTYEDKYKLAWQYKDDEEKRQAILATSGEKDDDAEFGYQERACRVRKEEAWHAPSGKGATDGRHVICIGTKTLLDVPWDGGRRNKPEFAVFRWSLPTVGWYGQGLVEQGKAIQVEINKLVRQIQNGHHLITGRWLVEGNSKVIAAHINNDLASLLRYTGTRPEYIAPAIIAPEMYAHLWRLKQEYYELAGMSETLAASEKPQGLKSGEAQREYKDTQTETLLERGQRYEAFVQECGQLVTDAAKELAEDGAYEVRAMADDAFETIKWNELDDPDGYECRVSASSSLPGTTAAKVDLGYDLMKLGVYDSSDIAELIGMPDTLQKTRLKLASRKLVEKKVGEMLRLGKPYMPTPFLNLDEAIAISRDMHNLAESKDVADDRLQLVRDFLEACEMMKPAMPAPPPQMMAPGQAGMMAPGAMGPAPGAPGAPPLPPVPQAA